MDSTAYGAAFIFGRKGYYFGGSAREEPVQQYSNKMWSFDASKYVSGKPVGIIEVKPDISFSLYPNPASGQNISIATSEKGEIIFYDELGQIVSQKTISKGINAMQLNSHDGILLYQATFPDGNTKNGKLVLY